MLPQWATRAFRSSESYQPQPRERLQSMLGYPLVLKGSKLAAFRAVEIYQKIPVYCPTFRFNPVGSPYQKQKGGRPGRSASSKL
jgi:hypothetical protein